MQEAAIPSDSSRVYVVCWSTDTRDGRVTRLDGQVEAMYGLTAEVLLADPDFPFTQVHADDRPAVAAALAEARSKGYSGASFRLICANGQGRWIHLVVRARGESEGATGRLEGTQMDITNLRSTVAVEDHLYAPPVMYWTAQVVLDREAYVSPSFADIWGVPAERLFKGGPAAFLATIHPEDRQRVEPIVTDPIRHGESDLEYRILRPNQEVRWIRARTYPVRGPLGKTFQVVGLAMDITDQRRIHPVHQVLENRCQAVVGQGWDLIVVTDLQDRVTYVSESIERILGYSSEELGARGFYALVHPNDLPALLHLAESLRGGHRVSGKATARCRHKNGTHRRLEFMSISLLDDPDVAGVVSSARVMDEQGETRAAREDIHMELESRVAQRTAELQDLYDNAPCGYYSVGPDAVFLRINDTFLRWLGYAREELLGRMSSLDLVPSEMRIDIEERFSRLKAEGNTLGIELTYVRKDGTRMSAAVSLVAVRGPVGEFLHARVTVVDDTDRRRALNEMVRAAQAKDEFLAGMSHELRTPLNGMLGLCELLLEGVRGPLGDKQRAAVQRIEESGRYLLSLICDVLDLAKIEAGKVELALAPVNFPQLCQGSLRLVQEAATRRGVNLASQIGEVSAPYIGDALRLKQILLNLLGNAVKFTPAGGSVRLDLTDVDGVVRISVTDTGIGIAAADIPRLFQSFVQLDASLGRESGTGLGLALVRRLAQLHRGTVELDSVLGKGSRFTVVLPRDNGLVAPPDSKPVSSGIPIPIVTGGERQARVLVVDDDRTATEVLSDYLSAGGYQVYLAHGGAEAVALALDVRPDIILMDVQMPRVDGLTAIRAIRGGGLKVPIVALTALAMRGDRERCLEAGATEYLSKPFNMKILHALLRRLLERPMPMEA